MLHLLWQEQMEQLDQFLVQDIFLVEVVEVDNMGGGAAPDGGGGGQGSGGNNPAAPTQVSTAGTG